MDKQQAKNIIKDTFEKPFNKGRFTRFIKNLLNKIDESKAFHARGDVKESYSQVVKTYERIGTYNSPSEEKIDIIIVYLQNRFSLDHARVTQRNFAGKYLSDRGQKDAGLFSFVPPDCYDWRFSLVKMDYKFEETKTGKMKVKEEFTPARRWSFLVGASEKSHTAQSRLVNILANDEHSPTLAELEQAFDIETVTKEFFVKYRDLFIRTKESLDIVVKSDLKIKSDFETKGVNSVDFAKKLLGQIIFLYFLQKKGWFGVSRDADWGTGSKHFLRELFDKKHGNYKNFFNDVLEHLFYDALRNNRDYNDYYYSHFNCKIPFLNGGLFDPIGNYDWVHTDICLPKGLFSNTIKTKDGDTGDGILDIFDRYNFTVKEDEPLEKEVAIDPELLGKAYEKFNAIRPDNFEEYKKMLMSGKKGEENKFNKQYGVYYAPREIVHYMCQQSLINYLAIEFNGKLNKSAIEFLILKGEQYIEYLRTAKQKKENNADYRGDYKENQYFIELKTNAFKIDEALSNVKICDPAVGSGAFPVGMMTEIIKARMFFMETDCLDSFYTSPKIERLETNSYNLKRECIEKSLYGVDIDPGAVEIAKLRLWLSLIVDEVEIENIKPLPNLDYKIVCGNSLFNYPHKPRGFGEIEKLKEKFFKEVNPNLKTKLRTQIDDAIYGIFKNTENNLGYKVTMDFSINFSEVLQRKGGFDIVIANPPYVCTKGRDETDKKSLTELYGFADDLYNHFYFKGMEILSENKGILCYISSKTFWTIQTKRNLRELFLKNRIIEVYDTASPFEAMVDTCVIIVRKYKYDSNYMILIKDGKKDLLNPVVYKTFVNTYLNSPNKVFFIPHVLNMNIHNKYSNVVKYLMDKWWNKISTSKNIEKNKTQLEEYRKSLKPGDITLLGLITEGGQGLATANNGRYVGVLEGTRYAENVRQSRPEKLSEAISLYDIKELNHIKNKNDANEFLNGRTEYEIRVLFDKLKEKYGRDIFGQGYLFRIISEDEVSNVESLSKGEKENGMKGNQTFVPYDKGDREGNRWYLKTPYYIDWCQENVRYLKENSGKKGEGMPVVRNPQFYFRAGFCWTDVNSTYLKARLKEKGVYDVLSMSLFSMCETIQDWYFIFLINSRLISEYVACFVNSSPHFQINDARQIPIVIPTKKQLLEFENVFNEAYEIQKSKFNGKISPPIAEKQLDKIQQNVDQLVYQLYGLTP